MFAKQSPSMGDLARLLFKAHSEVNTLVEHLSPGLRQHLQPLLDLAIGDRHMSLKAASPKSFEASFRQGPLQYILVVDNLEPGKLPCAQAKLVNHETGKTTDLSASAIVKGDVPAEFAELHKTVTAQMRHVLPAALWERLQSMVANTGETQGATDAAPAATAATDISPADEMVQVILPQEDGPDLRFTGKLLYGVRTRAHLARWTELLVYQTRGGKFVGIKHGRSLHLGEVDRTTSHVADSLEGLSDFFGHGRAAKHLLEQLGVKRYRDIE